MADDTENPPMHEEWGAKLRIPPGPMVDYPLGGLESVDYDVGEAAKAMLLPPDHVAIPASELARARELVKWLDDHVGSGGTITATRELSDLFENWGL